VINNYLFLSIDKNGPVSYFLKDYPIRLGHVEMLNILPYLDVVTDTFPALLTYNVIY